MLSFLFQKTPLKFYVQSIWRDEAFTYLLAKQNIFQIVRMTALDSNPPLYYLLLHFWMAIFGGSEFALRTLSFLFFIGSLYVAGLFLIDVFRLPVRRAFIFLALFVASPVLHYYAFEARMYSLIAFTVSLSFYFLYKRDYRKYMAATIISMYTHYFTFFALAGQILYLALTTPRHDAKRILRMFAGMFLSYLPWIAVVLFSRPPVANGFWIQKLLPSTLFNVPAILLTGYEQYQWFPYRWLPYVSLFLYAVAGYSLFMFAKGGHLLRLHVDHRKHGHIGLLLFCWVMIPTILVLLVSAFKPLFLPRYLIFITFGMLLSFIYMVRSFRPAFRYGVFAVLLLVSLNYANLQMEKRVKANIRKPLLEIKRLMDKNDVVFVTHEFNYHPAQYYINDRQVYLYGKTYEEVPWYVGKVLFDKNKVANTLPVYPDKAFVLKDNLNYSVQAIY